MTRMTAVLATLFFIISLVLGNLNTNKTDKGSEWENLTQPAQSKLSHSQRHLPSRAAISRSISSKLQYGNEAIAVVQSAEVVELVDTLP